MIATLFFDSVIRDNALSNGDLSVFLYEFHDEKPGRIFVNKKFFSALFLVSYDTLFVMLHNI